MNYARSERAAEKIQAMYEREQRELEKRAGRQDRAPMIGLGETGGNPVASLVPLARMAEALTTSTIVEITQTEQGVQVVRNDDYTLECDFLHMGVTPQKNPLGNESCTWDGTDLVIQIALPGSFGILQRLTVAPNRQELRVQTTVALGGGRAARFSLDKFFYRFEPPVENYQCQYTLTRGNVCSSKSP